MCSYGNKRSSAARANESRFVAKIPRAVESVHDIIKRKYRISNHNHKLDEDPSLMIGAMLRITCHINNMFGKRLFSG